MGHLASGFRMVEEKKEIVGLNHLEILKVSSTNINDGSLVRLLKMLPQAYHLEVSNCQNLTEYFFSQVSFAAPNLRFLDMNLIPSMTQKAYEEFLEKKSAKLKIRRFAQQIADPKDNGLRRPLKIAGKKTKKGKKKKGKKKKK